MMIFFHHDVISFPRSSKFGLHLRYTQEAVCGCLEAAHTGLLESIVRVSGILQAGY